MQPGEAQCDREGRSGAESSTPSHDTEVPDPTAFSLGSRKRYDNGSGWDCLRLHNEVRKTAEIVLGFHSCETAKSERQKYSYLGREQAGGCLSRRQEQL